MNIETFEMYRRPDFVLLPELVSLGQFVTAESRIGGVRRDGTDGLEIGFLEHGSVEWWDGSDLQEAGPNSILIDRPGDWQGGASAIVHPCTRYWLRFNFPAGRALPGLGLASTKSLHHEYSAMARRHFPGSAPVRILFQEILRQQREPQAYGEEYSRALFHQILIAVLRDYERNQQKLSSRVVTQAVEFLVMNLSTDIRMDQVSRHVGFSTGYFHDVFLRETGYTPSRYHLILRIAAAKRALIRNEHSITDIALDLGFSSSQYFATTFKKVVGLTPVAYRQLRADST